nr:MAG TPA: hypothetical protein [Caudoviricetes sp.]
MYCQYKKNKNILHKCIDKTFKRWYCVVTIQNVTTKCRNNAR